MNKQKIENKLLEIGVPASIRGFQYIVDTILILDERKDVKITKDIYPKVAELNKTTPSRVERAIRHAFEIVRTKRGNPEIINYYIGFENVSNFDSLSMLHLRLKNESDRREVPGNLLRQAVREELVLALSDIEFAHTLKEFMEGI